MSSRTSMWMAALGTAAAIAATSFGVTAASGTKSPSFTITPLLRPDGDSEPAIAIDQQGTMAMTGLSWEQFGTNLWTGPVGSTPTFRGVVDSGLQQPGKRVFGGGDADVDLGSTGTLHASTLIFLVNPQFTAYQLGVSAIACPAADASTFALSGCTKQIIDTAGADRQWITSNGPRVWISYHDSSNSSLIRVQRSDDDGYTWSKVGDPIVGQDGATGNATFNNTQGPIVADGFSGNVYDVYAAGEAGLQKGTSASFNNIYVSKSTDGGMTWTAVLVAHRPLYTALNNVFPTLATDPTNGNVYAAWSDGHQVFFSASTDQGSTWSTPVAVSSAPATTAIFPWLAARSGKVDLVYYGTTASSDSDTSAAWFVYIAQTLDNGASFAQTRVNPTPNHYGVICTGGTSCAPGTRNLLDLFEVAIDPTGHAGIMYTDDTLTTTSSGDPLPQVVLAQEK